MICPVLNDIYLFSTGVALEKNEGKKNPIAVGEHRELNSPVVSKG